MPPREAIAEPHAAPRRAREGAGAARRLLASLITSLLASLPILAGSHPVPSPAAGEPRHGSLRVLSDPPGARLLLDDRVEARTPAYLEGLAPGSHRLQVTFPAYEAWSGKVEIKAGEESTIWASLDPLPGTLTVEALPPGGLILVDGKMKAKTSWTGTLEAGPHSVVVRLEGFIPGARTVLVGPAANVRVEIRLEAGTNVPVGNPGEPPIRRQDRLFDWPVASEHPGSDGAPLILVPAGEFLMGSPRGDPLADRNEKPQRRILLDAFLIDRFEVPNAAYRKFLAWVKDNGHGRCQPSEPEDKDHTPGTIGYWGEEWNQSRQPVTDVDWWDAAAYCAWAGRRLPTEAEWERVARGAGGRTYPWGEEAPRAGVHGNFADRSYQKRNPEWTWLVPGDDGYAWPAPVGSFPLGASDLGVEDLAGNVSEWVADWYAESYAEIGPERNPHGPEKGHHKILKGGAWNDTAWSLRGASRVRWMPGFRVVTAGFRCAMDAPQGAEP